MLPRMTMGDWLFWAIIVWIGVHLVWLGLFTNSPVWIGTIIATVLGFVTFRYGPRPKEEEEEEE
jgi:predicted small integral membrane protein